MGLAAAKASSNKLPLKSSHVECLAYILEVARKGIVPRVTRRFHDLEKQNVIRSSVIVSRKKKAELWTACHSTG